MSILQLPPAATAPPAPDSAPGGGSGAPPGPPFASVLEHQQARTATAEGLAKQDPNQQPAQAPSGDDAAPVQGSTLDPVTPGTKDEPVTVADASALVALLGGVSPAKPAAGATAAPIAGDATAAAAPTPQAAAGSPAGAVASAATAAFPTTPATAPALAAATTPAGSDAAPATPGTTTGSPAGVVAQPTTGHGATPQSAAPSPSASATPVPGGTPPTSLPTSPQNDAAKSLVNGDQPTTATAPGVGSAVTATPVTATPVAAPQVTAPPSATPAAPVAPPAGVGLDRAIETVRLALRAAADRGVAHARIELHPRELGGIEIHLRQTTDGLVARVVAEHATAAQLLQHAGAELRRSLETQGLTLLRLDIGASGEQDPRAPGEQRGFGDPTGDRAGATDDAAAIEDATTPTDPAETTIALVNGALVDVLA